MRAEYEVLVASRTWMFTGTFRDQYVEREPVTEEVTRYLKRLRHNTSVRYLVCFERHRSGAFHIHALLHTSSKATWADVTKPWIAGFYKANLVRDVSSARYVTKYVSKDISDRGAEGRRPRVRASRNPRYGDPVMCHEEEIVKALQARKINPEVTWTNNLKEMLRILDVPAEDKLWEAAMKLQRQTS